MYESAKMTLICLMLIMSRIQEWSPPYSLRRQTMQHDVSHYGIVLRCFCNIGLPVPHSPTKPKLTAFMLSIGFLCEGSIAPSKQPVRTDISVSLPHWQFKKRTIECTPTVYDYIKWNTMLYNQPPYAVLDR